MSDLSKRIASLSPQQRALFEQRLKQQGLSAPKVQTIPRRPPSAPLRLSFAQQRLWVLDQLEPGNPFYNDTRAVRLNGALDVCALAQSLNAVVRRHEALRTAFVLAEDEPRQVIAPELVLDLPVVDMQWLPAPRWEAAVGGVAADQNQQTFDLSRVPLLRTALVRLSAQAHVLLVTVHHIVSDGWSTDVLIQEVATLYAAFATGSAWPLPELPIQYADFALWQRELLQGPVLETHLAYWRERLDGAPPLLELPTDEPRPAVMSFRGATHTFALPGPLYAALTALSQGDNVSLFMTLLAAFDILLYRYSRQSDIVVGTPVANRTRAETTGLIGFFANMLVLRADLSGNPSFRAVLQQVRTVTLGAYAHQDLPFEQLVELFQPTRDLSYTPLFQVMFSLQRALVPRLERAGVTTLPFDLPSTTAKFDLSLFMWEGTDQLTGQVEYSTDLFEAATIARLAGHVQTLLANIAVDPDQRLGDLSFLTPAERYQLLVEWNVTDSGDSHETAVAVCIHQLFEAQAARTPDAIALIFEATTDDELRIQNSELRTQHLTYVELNARANQLARVLRQRGVGPDVLVGIGIDRSLELVMAVLGVLKAGGAYIPLDPSYPPARLAFMLQDSGATVLITANDQLSDKETRRQGDKEIDPLLVSPSLLLPFSRSVVDLCADWPMIARQPGTALDSGVAPDNLAYVIYTSGSTGTPKGVLIPHHAVANLLHAMREQLGLTARDTLLSVTTLSFDIAALELFLPLIVGAQVVLVSRHVVTDGGLLAARLEAVGATVMQATPATWRLLVESGWSGRLSLRMLTGGEALSAELAKRLRARGAALWNVYGPTETTIWSSHTHVSDLAAPITIGRPLANTQMYILDAWLRPVPIGVAGELYIGGAGLARGYLGRPDLTAERFLPNPFADEGRTTKDERPRTNDESNHRVTLSPCHLVTRADSRLYRSGDLARYLPDGQIDFLGRIDDQIKLRGYRIELDEIAIVLEQHPNVRACVVVARSDTAEEPQLAAYVVPRDNEGRTTKHKRPSLEDRESKIEDSNVDAQEALSSILYPLSSELRGFLAARLPDYMLPAMFVMLDELPLAPNGKVDRGALPAPDRVRGTPGDTSIAPRTPLEELLARIWAELLHLERVGAHDNFFALGGHSILAIQSLARLRQAAQIELPLRSIFEAPTVAALAERIAGARPEALPQKPPQAALEDPPLVLAQQSLWVLDQLEPGNSIYHMPAALRLGGPLDLRALERSFNAVVARHESLRTTFMVLDGRVRKVVAPTARLRLSLLDLRNYPAATREDEARRLASAETERPFDLAAGPLLRAGLLRLDDTEHVLVLTLHQIIADDWSLAVLLQELTTLYAAFSDGRPNPLPELPASYTEYARWQHDWLSSPAQDDLLAYWTQRLAGAPAVLALPVDRPRPPVQTFHGAAQSRSIPQPITAALRRLGEQTGSSLFMTLLAAFEVVLARYSGQQDLVVGTITANRSRPEFEPLIGCFANPLVLRTEFGGDPAFRELLERVRESCLGAYAHQEQPFERLIEVLQPERNLSYTPLFQVMVVLQTSPLPTLELPNLLLRLIELERRTTRFDLTLVLQEDDAALTGHLEYNTDLFDVATIRRLLGHFRTLLEAIVADPDRRVSALPLLGEDERWQLLVEWNDTAAGVGDQESGVSTIADGCIHELFEAQAAYTPDAVAVVFDLTKDERRTTNDQRPTTNDERRTTNGAAASSIVHRPSSAVHLTYRELNAHANRLAHHLRGLGVGPEARVGICMERSPELVIALLGVHKAGGAYVPLDRKYPAERISFMLEDSGAAMVLTNDERRTTNDERSPVSFVLRPSSFVDLQAIDLRNSWVSIAREPATRVESGARPEHPAYALYTSGSTGQPKGVLIPHAALVNHMRWMLRDFPLRADDRVLQNTPFSFDASVWEFYAPLLAGAQLVVAPPGAERDSAHLAQLVAEHAITTLQLVPSLLRVLLDEPSFDRCTRLRRVFCGGESLAVELQARFFARSRAGLYNLYGPTEACIDALAWSCRSDPRLGSVPIGRPVANMRAYVLDHQLRPAPIGVAGELYLGGVQLARGYLDRPDLTAAAFVPNPFGTMNDEDRTMNSPDSSFIVHRSSFGSRLYRTGDLARYRPDGSIELLSRIDHQVKIRGVRIELGEIEAVLAQHPDVREAVAIAREYAPGDKRLVAYIVPTNNQRPTTNDQRSEDKEAGRQGDRKATTLLVSSSPGLDVHPSSIVNRQSSIVQNVRVFLAERLPGYMLPSAFVLLERLPLTPNGKLDRKALPAPTAARPDLATAFVAPRTPTEELVAGICGSVLGVARLGVDDNFFEMGGHSLLATQVIARLRLAFQVELSVRVLFEAPTVAALATRVEAERQTPATPLFPLLPVARPAPLPLSFAQQRMWFIDQLQPRNPAYNIPAAMRLNGTLDLPALRSILNAIVQRHEALRTAFVLVDGQPAQVIAAAAQLPLTVVDLQVLPAGTREPVLQRLATAEAHRAFDLTRSPLVRGTFVRLAADKHVVLLTMHHIVSDGWSLGILMREVMALYAAFSAGQSPPLPALPLQYADFALWQREWLQGQVLERQLDYWRQQLHEPLPVLELAIDHPRPPIQSYRGRSQIAFLPQPLGDALMALSRREGITLFMTLLAALKTLLWRYTGQVDIVVGSSIANRTRPELETLIGFFVNTLALRTDLRGNPAFRTLLECVRDVTLGAYDHQDVPFEKLAEVLRPNRDPSYSLWFQVLFVLQNAPMPTLEIAGLRLEPMLVESGTAKFDLTVSMEETAQGLRGWWEYNTDLFEATTITRMIGHFATLLAGVVANPARRLGDLPLLSGAEQHQFLVEWNALRTEHKSQEAGDRTASPASWLLSSDSLCVHELFAAQAARTPDAVAVAFDEQRSDERCLEGAQTNGTESSSIVYRPWSFVHLTYSELDRRANQLARYLRSLEVGPEVRVGVCLERSPDQIIALLAVLKAGGAYVPVDPSYPAERLRFMLADSGARVLVMNDRRPTTNDQRPTANNDMESVDCRLPAAKTGQGVTLSPCHLVRLDADWPLIAQQPTTALSSATGPDNLAYVIYTSGTLGTPKGVLIQHRSLAYYTQVAAANYALGGTDRVLQFAAISFDASAEELYPALTSGATLVLRTEWMLETPARFLYTCWQWALTMLNLPTVYWHLLVAGLGDAGVALPAGIRCVIIGGEQALPERLVRWRKHVSPQVQLVNTYGPTEATIVATFHRLTGAGTTPASAHEIPIGRPIPNVQTYVLDQALRPLPVGIRGELCIGGIGLARGYLGQPALTAARFIPNPFGTMNDEDRTMKGPDSSFIVHRSSFGSRLYRTGDLARYRPDGVIEFLGRIDHQVKLRGFRIELDEIETALLQHPAVRQSAVLLRENPTGDKRLIAYVVPSEGTGDRGQGSGVRSQETKVRSQSTTVDDTNPRPPSIVHRPSSSNEERSDSSFLVSRSSFASELRAFLKERLPEYMLPSAFVVLESLPLSTNGKLDRQALPPPDLDSARSSAFVPPRRPTEELVAAIWTSVLDLARLGVHDNFFELGGHSLLATRVVARLGTAFQIELPLRALFEAPTVAELAALIERTQRARAGLAVPPLRPFARNQSLPLSFAQRRLWFLDQLQPGLPTYIIPLAVRLSGTLDLVALQASFSAIVRRHEALHTTFVGEAERPIQRIGAPAPLPLAVVNLQALPSEPRASLAGQLSAEEAQRPFDLARGPLVRARVLRLGAAEHIVLLTMHHIVSDGWSIGLFIQELAAFYTASLSGEEARLPKLAVQYADYTLWQQQWLQGERLAAHLGYWQHQLAELPLLELPLDHPRPALQTFEGMNLTFALAPGLTDRLQMLSRRAGVTLFMTLLAAFDVLLARYSGQTDIVVGSPIAGRTQRETEDLIGCFVNTLVLRSDLRGNPRFHQLLQQVREACLQAYAHQDLPFEMLVEELHPVRDLSRTPLFQVLFVLQNTPMAPLKLPGLTLSVLEVAGMIAKFDLSLFVQEIEDGLAGSLEYNSDLFDATTINRMAAHFKTLLEGIIAQPDACLSALPLLSAPEREQLLVEWNDTLVGVGDQGSGIGNELTDACIHELFAAQAARTPDAIALVFDAGRTKDEGRTTKDELIRVQGSEVRDQSDTAPISDPHPPTPGPWCLTYAELNARANQLAQHLRSLGVGPDVPVGLCVEPSIEMIIGILGVLKAGGAYMPLDPSYPTERISFMLEDSGAALLVTNDERRPMPRGRPDERVSSSFVLRRSSFVGAVLDLHTDWPTIAREAAHAPDVPVSPDNLAYVIYTSGSTGRPKGVMVQRGGLLNLCYGLRAFFADPDVQHIGLITSISFDISVNQIFPTLLFGRTLHVIPEAVKLNGPALLTYVATRRLQLLDVVPSYMQAVLATVAPARIASDLRYLLIGGEKLDPQLVEAIFSRVGAQVALVNIYGLTEITDINAFAVIRAADQGQPITAGRPLQNNRIYLTDAQLNLLPVGVAGEVCIAGESMSRGYLKRPDLTAQRFVPNPFAEVSGIRYWVLGAEPSDTRYPTPDTRLYRTGDLGRRRLDGTIEILGRIDQQIKLRGFRIEQGEIEAVLLQHPGVTAAVVVAREDVPGDQRLVAYIVPAGDERRTMPRGRPDERRTTNDDRRPTMDDGMYSEPSSIVDRPSSSNDGSEPSSFVLRPSSISSELRTWLGSRLPSSMLPSAFVMLESLPLSANGKLDRRALPPPDFESARISAFVPPRTSTEEVVASIWGEVLGIAQVGIHDNFFDLGGHSLLVMQVVSRIREAFQTELPVRNLFEAPTVLDLSAMIDQRVGERQGTDLDVIRRVNSGDPRQPSISIEQLSDREVEALLRGLLN